MMVVYKYAVPIDDDFFVEMPRGAEVLHVGQQRGRMQLWAKVDDDESLEVRRFRLAGTGHPLGAGALKYVGTVMMQQGDLVFHLFEDMG